MEKLIGAAVIGQSGGPTAAINAIKAKSYTVERVY